MTAKRQKWGFGLPDQAPPDKGARSRSRLGGDVSGALTAALVTIPISMGYGIMALSPLGPEYVPLGLLAGLYAVICGCLTAVVLGANTTMIYAPRSVITFLIGSLVLQNFVRSSHEVITTLSDSAVLAVVFGLIFLAGAFQALLGLLRLGNLVKYLPAPVLAGFQNAAAVLIAISQIDVLLGFTTHIPLSQLPEHVHGIQPVTLAIGIVVTVFALKGSLVSRRIPPSIQGLVAGTLLYHIVAFAGFSSHLGPTIGTIPFAWPSPRYLTEFLPFFTEPRYAALIPVLISSALSLALVATLDSMLCARLIESDSGHRFHGNRELVRLGVGNMVSAAFGGISNGCNLAASFANHRAGARTSASVVFVALLVLGVILILGPLMSLLPRVVVAALLLVVGIQLVDRWTMQMLGRIWKADKDERYGITIDLSVILLVAALAIFANIVLAVLLGVLVAIGVFLFRISKSVIRREYRCDAVHSRKTRDPRMMSVLAEHGRRIVVVELEGPIFFGTAENLSLHLEELSRADATHIILDFKRVNEIDSTGARIILQTHDRLVQRGKHLLISAVTQDSPTFHTMRDIGVLAAVTTGRLFPDTDSAIEHAEEHVILDVLGGVEVNAEFPFSSFDVLSNMSPSEVATIREMLERRTYAAGDVVFREGEDGRELFMIARGTASVRIRLPGTQRTTRLVTFSAGTIFGELALLDQEVRSATVVADDDLVCYVLSQAHFNLLSTEHPFIAIKLMANLARELSSRLRRANRTIYQLDN